MVSEFTGVALLGDTDKGRGGGSDRAGTTRLDKRRFMWDNQDCRGGREVKEDGGWGETIIYNKVRDKYENGARSLYRKKVSNDDIFFELFWENAPECVIACICDSHTS